MKRQYLVVLFFSGLLWLNYPVLAIYNIPAFVFGIPSLFFWVFSIWVMLIFSSFWIVQKSKNGTDKNV